MIKETGLLALRPICSMADNEPEQEPKLKPEPERGSKADTKNGGHTIPVQMFWARLSLIPFEKFSHHR